MPVDQTSAVGDVALLEVRHLNTRFATTAGTVHAAAGGLRAEP